MVNIIGVKNNFLMTVHYGANCFLCVRQLLGMGCANSQ